eukprot:Awhi_evm1s314
MDEATFILGTTFVTVSFLCFCFTVWLQKQTKKPIILLPQNDVEEVERIFRHLESNNFTILNTNATQQLNSILMNKICQCINEYETIVKLELRSSRVIEESDLKQLMTVLKRNKNIIKVSLENNVVSRQ